MKIFSNYLPIERYDYLLTLDKFKDKSITIFNDYVPSINQLRLNKINILILNEPNEFFGLHQYAVNNYTNFNIILTWSTLVLNACPNAVLFPHAETNLDENYILSYEINPKRIFNVTFLCGVLDKIEGHQLRQRVYQKENDIKTPHNWWYVLDDFDHKRGNRPGYFETKISKNGNPIEGEGKKQVWNTNSMFHVAIENSKHDNYLTDKIIDCFATRTLPIYWGAPNIDEYYDSNGIITFKDENDLVDIINNLTEDDYYKRIKSIDNNYYLAKQQGFFFKRLENYLDELIKINEI